MLRVLAIDVGSSSIKAGLLKGGRLKRSAHIPVASAASGNTIEIPAAGLLAVFRQAIVQVMEGHKKLDAITIDSFCPGLVGLDRRGRPIVGCISHQDRRSEKQALELQKRIGRDRHLALTGNLPFPGGIASTSLLWIKENQPAVFKQIHRIGQPATLLIHALTGQWVIDPSQAAFLGLYDAVHLSGWVPELLAAVGIRPQQLPDLRFADDIAGTVTPAAARSLGLPVGCPVFSGIVDTSAAMLATDCQPGRMVHSAGSTDVLAICLPQAHPAPDILTRPLGTHKIAPKTWLAVSTIAAGGSSIKWAYSNLFPDLSFKDFNKLLRRLADNLNEKSSDSSAGDSVQFSPYLAGDRTSLETRRAEFSNLTLATTRQQMLSAMLSSLAQASRRRFIRLSEIHRPKREIFTMGGQKELADLMHRCWPGKWSFTPLVNEAIGGLNRIATNGRSLQKSEI